ncbi:MAG: hypothetical protein IK095_07100 [Oscillospiraceae bacterium]|nr:hypothetical protein [Oscillospiraceae bacterium]
MAEQRGAAPDMIQTVDFLFSFCREREPDRGLDSFLYALNCSAALIGCFGGYGEERSFPGLKGRTGPWLAARAAAAAYMDRFEQSDGRASAELPSAKAMLLQYLKTCRDRGVGPDAPGTGLSCSAAVALCQPGRVGTDVQLQWVGSARAYLLDEEGLCQLTQDDRGGLDAMDALCRAAPPQSLVSLEREFELHTARLSVSRPGLLFTATDGCMAGLTTPMELEDRILRCLMAASNVKEMEATLSKCLGEQGGDCALSGLGLGFGGFDAMKRRLAGRARQMHRDYIEGLDACSPEEKQLLWEHYRDGYHRLLSQI